MSALNRPDNFAGRVDYAAAVIAAGRSTTRSFDNCFENSDGDAVAAALVRRSKNNPKLAANLWRYICRQTAEAAAHQLEGKNLPAEAARMRAESAAKYEKFIAERRAAQSQ